MSAIWTDNTPGIRRSARGLIVATAVLLAGCTSSAGVAGTATPAHDMSMHSAASAPGAVASSAGGPSEATLMACGADIRRSAAIALALPDLAAAKTSWGNGTYTCTYQIPSGTLTLAMTELADPAAARGHLETLRGRVGGGEPIVGVAGLGLPGYRAPDGTVLFAKDHITLQVDVVSSSDQIGPNNVSKSDYAYQIATNVLACWKAHPPQQ